MGPPGEDGYVQGRRMERMSNGVMEAPAGRVVLLRGGGVESEHRVHAVVTDARGSVVASFGQPDRPVFLRSAAKPFQALPLVEDGAADRFGLSDEELALACGSHGGEEAHVLVARRILARVGMDDGALACGPQLPMHGPSARALLSGGGRPERIHNNCSGKHAGMLLLARDQGWAVEGYHEAGHPVQERMAREVAHWTGLRPADLGRGIDGCGVVCFTAPLVALARGYAALFAQALEDRGDAASRVVAAMTRYPFHVAGTGRLCTALMEAFPGAVLAKVGAEGVYGAAFRGREGVFGVAIKVEDGARRAVEAALVALLVRRGLREGGEGGGAWPAVLDPWSDPVVPNTRGEPVARLQVEFPGMGIG